MKDLTRFSTLLIILSSISSAVISHKISGSLVCQGNCVRSGPEEAGQMITISIRDVSVADAESTELAITETYLSEAWSFPLHYEIEFDGTRVLENKWRSYSISARIFKDTSLRFITDTNNDLTNSDKTGLRTEIDMNVVRVQ